MRRWLSPEASAVASATPDRSTCMERAQSPHMGQATPTRTVRAKPTRRVLANSGRMVRAQRSVAALLPLLAFYLAFANVAPADGSMSGPLVAIEADRSSGEITDADALLYRFFLVSDPDRVPSEYLAARGEPIRCATQIYVEMGERVSEYPEHLQREIQSLLGRPDGLDGILDTEHFRIHHAVSGPRAPQGWPDRRYLEAVAAAAERSWSFYHEIQNWQTPPSDGVGGGDSRIDIYIDDLGTGFYGYTEPFGAPDDAWPYTRSAFIVIDNDYHGFGYLDPTDPMRVTVAHEYHHVVQMGYTVSNNWWMESLATFMEDEVYDEIDDNYGYLACLTGSPYKSLTTFDGCHEYGAFLFPTWLSENYGHDLTRRVQECAGTNGIFSCLERELTAVGTTFDEAFADFWTWNFYTGVRDDGRHYLEGAAYEHLVSYDRIISSYPALDLRPAPSLRPEALGASVLRLRPGAAREDILLLDFSGPSCTQRVVLIQKLDGENVFIEHYMNLRRDPESASASGLVGKLEIKDWDHTEYAHLFVILNRSLGSGSFDYSVNAISMEQAADVGDPLYTRTVVLDQNEPNPFRRFTQIRYALTEAGPVRLEIFDAGGRVVRTLVDAVQEEGIHSVSWDGRDDPGQSVSPGAYFYRIVTPTGADSRKMIVLRD